MERILIFTGKGGVGKTSIAAAHARHSALQGNKTLIVSTDMAHNLSDIFETNLGKDVQEVSENLYAYEVDANYMMAHEFEDMKRGFANMIRSAGIPLDEIETLSVFPGQDELFSLLKIMTFYESGAYGRIIVDCAPTGETLSLLKFPELLSWYMEKFFPIEKVAMKVLAPISKTVFKIELPNQEAMSDMEKMYLKLMKLQALLKNREVTSIRLVTIPEKMVVEETKRNYMYMNLFDFHVDGIYINRILPKDIGNHFFDEWLDIQNQYIEELEMVFASLPIYRIPWFDCDLNGFRGIDRVVDQVLADRDVFKVVEDIHSERYEKTDNGYLLTLYLPFACKGDLNMHESPTDIIIKIGNFKRSIPKPSSLRHHDIVSATFEEQSLKIMLAG